MYGAKSKVGHLWICYVVVWSVLVYGEIWGQLKKSTPPPLFPLRCSERYWRSSSVKVKGTICLRSEVEQQYFSSDRTETNRTWSQHIGACVLLHSFRTIWQKLAECNFLWMVYQDTNFKICLFRYGWKENISKKFTFCTALLRMPFLKLFCWILENNNSKPSKICFVIFVNWRRSIICLSY